MDSSQPDGGACGTDSQLRVETISVERSAANHDNDGAAILNQESLQNPSLPCPSNSTNTTTTGDVAGGCGLGYGITTGVQEERERKDIEMVPVHENAADICVTSEEPQKKLISSAAHAYPREGFNQNLLSAEGTHSNGNGKVRSLCKNESMILSMESLDDALGSKKEKKSRNHVLHFPVAVGLPLDDALVCVEPMDAIDDIKYRSNDNHNSSTSSTSSSVDGRLTKTMDNEMTSKDNNDNEGVIFPNEYDPVQSGSRRPRSFGRWFLETSSALFTNVVPHGGTLSTVFNLSSVVFGAGIISIPSAFNTSGWLMSIIYLLIVTSLTVYSITLLAMAYEKTGYRSFESMAHGLFGPGSDIVVALLMWLLCFGAACGFVIAVGDVVGPVLNFESASPFLKSVGGRRFFQTLIWVLFMLPVSLPRQVNSLRHVSTVGVSFIMLFVVCVIIHSMVYISENGARQDMVKARGGNRAISGLAIFMFAYMCQVNSLKVYEEMKHRSVGCMTKDTAIACALCMVTYMATGLFGYAEFGSTITGSILKYYDPHSSIFFLIVYCGIVVKLCASFSQNMLACRTALFQVVHWDVNTMPFWKHTVVAASFAFSALVIGLLVPDVNMVFGLVGAFCGGFIGFIFPALFIMYSGNWGLRQVGWGHYLATYTLLICGVIGVVFGTVTSVYSTYQSF